MTPSIGLMLNIVEILFRVITRQATRRGTLTIIKDLIDAIETLPKTADEILTKIAGGQRPSFAHDTGAC